MNKRYDKALKSMTDKADQTIFHPKVTNILLTVIAFFLLNFYNESKQEIKDLTKEINTLQDQVQLNTTLLTGYGDEQKELQNLMDLYHPRKTSNPWPLPNPTRKYNAMMPLTLHHEKRKKV